MIGEYNCFKYGKAGKVPLSFYVHSLFSSFFEMCLSLSAARRERGELETKSSWAVIPMRTLKGAGLGGGQSVSKRESTRERALTSISLARALLVTLRSFCPCVRFSSGALERDIKLHFLFNGASEVKKGSTTYNYVK